MDMHARRYETASDSQKQQEALQKATGLNGGNHSTL
jgi:hypothetical protein